MVEFKLQGVDGVLDALRQLPPEVVAKRGGPVKSSLRKGAVVILKAEKAQLQAVLVHTPDSHERTSIGLLLKSLIASRGKAPTGAKGERYLVRVKRATYPDRTGKPVTTLKSAQIKEYGSEKQTATPWIRPAFLQNAEKAIHTVEDELVKAIDKVAKRLLAQGKAR